MLFVSLRDLVWRRRRFAIATVATAIVFSVALLMSGISASFNNEVVRTVDALGADVWLAPNGQHAPFTSPHAFPRSEVSSVAEASGVRRADPLVVSHAKVPGARVPDVNVIGAVPGGVGSPTPAEGRSLRPGDTRVAVVGDSLGIGVGGSFPLGGETVRVVGVVRGVSYYAGQPVVFIPLVDAQRLAFGGQPLADVVGVRGHPSAPVAGFTVLTNAQIEDDLRGPIKQATGTIELVKAMLWLVAAGIIGSIVYLSALDRLRDFAVLKATGASDRVLIVGLIVQALILSVLSAAVAALLAALLAPLFPMSVETPTATLLTLPLVAAGVGVVASLAGVRRALRVDPALAFSGA